jgi:hypothetical protein
VWSRQLENVDSDSQVSALSYATLPYAPPLTTEREWKSAHDAVEHGMVEVPAVVTEAEQPDPASPQVNEVIIPEHEDVPANIQAEIDHAGV